MISRASEYAIRALTHLAREAAAEAPAAPRFHLARDLGQSLGIPAPFLAKLLQPLVVRGIVASQRGRRGGFRLAHPPESVTLFSVVDAQEHLGRARSCLLGQAQCTDERACPLHLYWKRTSDEYLELLARTTLADLVAFVDARPGCGYPVPDAQA